MYPCNIVVESYQNHLTVHWLSGVTRELLEVLLVDSLQLRAAQATNQVADSACQLVKRAEEDIWLRW
jgi:hypothetical protein